MGGSQKKGRIILFGILAIIVLLVLGIGAGVLIGSRMAGSSRQATSSSSKTVQESPGSSESLWHGKDIRKSGKGVYPGMDKERACT